ncbi:NUDIX domain-containing protein [Chloroflexota bacterium]
MSEDLEQYLIASTKLDSIDVMWGEGTIPVKITLYLSDTMAPARYISSARSIVFNGNSVLVISQENGHQYILPGGRLEAKESPLDALHREILEETGWTVTDTRHIGFMHLHNLGSKPDGYNYPYPDIIWPIFISEAVEYKPDMKIPDEWVFDSEFRDIIEVKQLPLDKGDLLLLDEALKLRESGL